MANINKELLSLMDHTQSANQKFIKEFMDRVENQRRYEEKVKS